MSDELPPLDWAKCGTPAQAAAHYRRGEKPDEPCRLAHNRQQAKNRRKRRARKQQS